MGSEIVAQDNKSFCYIDNFLGLLRLWFKPELFTWMTDGSIQVLGATASLSRSWFNYACDGPNPGDDYRNLITLQKALATGILPLIYCHVTQGFLIAMSLNLMKT